MVFKIVRFVDTQIGTRDTQFPANTLVISL